MVHSTRRPVVVTDGFCPGCGKPAPIHDYLSIVQDFDGLLVLDDTQALGILGYGPDRANPYGSGGGGSLWFHGVISPKIVVISSLAKGFGTPLAVLAGNRALVSRFRTKSKTQIHCSPPSAADISAAEHALVFNATHGDGLRRRLVKLVRYLRHQIKSISVATTGGLFPVQTLQTLPLLGGQTLHTRLQNLGVRSVLHRHRQDRRARISFLITARHRHSEIENAVEVLRIIIADTGFRDKAKMLNYA
jgi:8-amino-7-oxononanoate synthase